MVANEKAALVRGHYCHFTVALLLKIYYLSPRHDPYRTENRARGRQGVKERGGRTHTRASVSLHRSIEPKINFTFVPKRDGGRERERDNNGRGLTLHVNPAPYTHENSLVFVM